MQKKKLSANKPIYLKSGTESKPKITEGPTIPLNLETKQLNDLSNKRWQNVEKSNMAKPKRPNIGRMNVIRSSIYEYSPEYGTAMRDYIISLCAEQKYQETLEYTQAIEIPHQEDGTVSDILAFSQQVNPTGNFN